MKHYDMRQQLNDEEYLERKRNYHKLYMKKKKRRKRIKITFICLGFILSIAGGFGLAKAEKSINGVLDLMGKNTEGDLNNVDLSGINIVSDDQVVNILLIGSDRRPNETVAGRSDSTMIATIDMKHKSLKLTSLMRDMYVAIPGHENNRFNAAYSYGGVELLYETIATNFKIKLDGYVVVDFEAFTNVIDQIGGVEISITESEYNHLIDYYKDKPAKKDVNKLKPGKNVMTGTQALCYARIRKEGKGDFRRTERQRTVLQSVFTKAKTLSLLELLDMMTTVMHFLSTDLENDQIISYMKTIVMMGTTELDQFRLPVDGSYTDETINGKKVLLPDIEANERLLNEFIYGK